MSMTRKDYVETAKIVSTLSLNTSVKPAIDKDNFDYLVWSLGNMFAKYNPNFDRARFEKACETIG